MFNLVGKYNILFITIFFLCSQIVHAQSKSKSLNVKSQSIQWNDFSKDIEKIKKQDYQNGLSYIISGAIALSGGLWGETITKDSLEKGVYTIFQSVGVASIGYGAYVWTIGGEKREIHNILSRSDQISTQGKSQYLLNFYKLKKEKEKKEKLIKAVSHALIAATNIYNASKQDQEGVKNALYFIGGINLLAAISFTF